VYGPHKDKKEFWDRVPLKGVQILLGDFNFIDSRAGPSA